MTISTDPQTFPPAKAQHRPAQSLALAAGLSKAWSKWLRFAHRWLGIAICAYFVVWFVSGLVLMYVGFPEMTDAQYVQTLRPVDWAAVRVSPSDALTALGLKQFPQSLRLEQTADGPVYRVVADDRRRSAVSAQTGRPLSAATAADAERTVRAFTGQPAHVLRKIDDDQWTVASKWNPYRPFQLVQVDDQARRQVYVSARNGEVALVTTAHERFWNYIGAVPHWIYFRAIRTDTGNWRQWVMWSSGIGIVVALSGIWEGVARFRLRSRYADGSVSPYRGWAKWHHILGLTGGFFILTWIITGWLSVGPFGLLDTDGLGRSAVARYAGHKPPNFPLAPAGLPSAVQDGAVRVSFSWLGGRPVVVKTDAGGASTPAFIEPSGLVPVTDQAIFDAARVLVTAPVAFSKRLTQPDEYWHSSFETRRLPMLRIGFADSAHTWVHIDPLTGALAGQMNDTSRVRRWIFEGLHDFDFLFLLKRRPLWDIVVWAPMLAGLAMSATAVVLGVRRLRKNAERKRAAATAVANTGLPVFVGPVAKSSSVLVAFASQTGTAESLARQTADAMTRAGCLVALEPLEKLSPADLAAFDHSLFVVATTGDGDIPDHAAAFQKTVMKGSAPLQQARYGVLALGDQEYSEYCRFGRDLDAWLSNQGAASLFPRVEVDQLNARQLQEWSGRISGLAGHPADIQASQPPFGTWRLVERTHLNPGSQGGAAYHLEFEPPQGETWTAGDVAIVAPDPAKAAYREYSIASLPEDGRLHLLVRQFHHANGRLGLGSGWLTAQAPLGGLVHMRLRSNPSFHPPEDTRPLILIGAGTGMAGLRAHLRRRGRLGLKENWLIFGERSRQHDALYRAELDAWRDAGLLDQLDLAFSRDEDDGRYVQTIVAQQADRLKGWIARGAAIYVCGSRATMGEGVHRALEAIFGAEQVETLLSTGLYRRDIY